MTEQFDYPALYDTAGAMSSQSQSGFLSLLKLEYGLLILAAVLSMNWSSDPKYFVVYASVLLGALGSLIARNFWKPEQGWYRGRALAESIKTLSWRYCMRAEPFVDAPVKAIPLADFRQHLLGILRANRFIGDRMPPDSAANEQVPDSMRNVRCLSLEERKAYYLEHRIREQRRWYALKARANKSASRRWVIIGITAYSTAIALALARVVVTEWALWPIDPVLVFASAVLGWTQVKRFNELASSYTLTAHEIGLTQGKLDGVTTETAFSEFVNDAEQAFSREHTQWVARQQT